MGTARKILSNTLAQIIGKVIVAILGVVVVKIVTGYLSVEGFGQYTFVYEFLAFFGIAADLGLFTVGVKEMAQDEKNIPKIIGNVLSLRTIMIALTMSIAVVSAFLIPKYQGTYIPIGITIAAFTTFVTILNGTITSVLQVKLKMEWASLTNVFGKIVSVGVMAYIVFFGFPDDIGMGFYMLMVAGFVGNLAMLLASYYFVRKITPLEYRFDFDLWKEVLKKALPFGLALILNVIYFRINSVLLFFLRGQAEVGIYGVSMRILEQFTIVPLYFMNSVLPVLTKSLPTPGVDLEHQAKNSTLTPVVKYKQIIRYSFDFLAAMSIPMTVGVFVLAYPIIFIVSTPDFLSRLSEGFYGSDIALQILIFAILFQFLNILFSFILVAINKQMKLLYINMVCVIFNVVANLIFIPIYGFRGAAFISVLSELFILIACYFTAKKYLNFSISLKNLIKITFSALVMGASIYFLQPYFYNLAQNWGILLLIPVGMIIYTIMLFVTKTVDKDMLALLKKSSPPPVG